MLKDYGMDGAAKREKKVIDKRKLYKITLWYNQGSKNRIAKDIYIPFMMPYLNGDNYFIDAFCGGCNLIDKVDYPRDGRMNGNKILNSINFVYYYKIVVMVGEYLPSFISKEEYYKSKL